MADNIHPVVELLAARMESHPEEFRFHDNQTLAITGRWETWIHQIRPFLNEAEDEMLFGKAKEAFLQRVHEEVLDDLLNGEDRRRQEREEYERTARTAQATSMGASLRNAISPAVQQVYDQMQMQKLGQYITDYDYATQTLRIKDTHTKQITSIPTDSGMVATIKKALGI